MSAISKSIETQIAHLETLSRSGLVEMWVKAFGSPPFKGARRTTLVRGIAYHEQSKIFGGLKPSLSRQLIKIAKTGRVDMTANDTVKPKTQIGTQLVREWNGRTYTVHVTDKGYVMSGFTYGSLSSVAKAITGAHWSGPRFFGVAG